MNTIFSSDFTTSALSDWTVEQHVPDGYRDFVIRGGRLVLLDAGNRIMPNTPALGSFAMRGMLEADWDLNRGEFSLHVFFSYDPYRRQGQSVEFGSHGAGTFARLISPEGEVIAAAESGEAPAESGLVEFELTVTDGEVCLRLNSRTCLTAPAGQDCRGQIALTRGAFLGELRLRSLTVDSDEPLAQEPLWTDLRIPFAPLNGMDIPIVWTVTATRVGTAARVEVELSGGEKTRPDVPWFLYHCHYVEVLDRPYLRIESAQSVVELRLSDGALVLAIPHKQYFYSIAHQDPPWPFRKTFYLREVPAAAVLFAGYEAYGNRAVSKHLEATSPYETAYEVSTGEIIYCGPALRPGGMVVGARSPADKQLCRDLPAPTVDYGRALAFAQANHYFAAGEACVFQFELFTRDGVSMRPPAVEYRMESAFFEPLTDYVAVELGAATETLASTSGGLAPARSPWARWTRAYTTCGTACVKE